MAETHKGFGLLFEMGCGKTLTAIMIAGTAYQMGKVEKVLVVAPTSFSGSTSSAGSHHWNAADCKASQITGQRNWG